MNTAEKDRARSQAKAQFDSIVELMERLEHANDCTDDDCKKHGSDDYDSVEDYHDSDKAQEAITDNALDCNVRSGWESSGADLKPAEYNILLCTGGPAVRIIRTLDEHGQLDRARLQYQDWGTPWTEYFLTGSDFITLRDYAGQFYFES